MEIGTRLKALRKSMGVGLRTLSKQSNLDGGEISKIENNKTNPTMSTLMKYADGLKVPRFKIFNMVKHGLNSSSTNSNAPTKIDLSKILNNHNYITYHGKRLDKDTINYIKSALEFRFGKTDNKKY